MTDPVCDLRIHGGVVVGPEGATEADLCVTGGKVVGLIAPDARCSAQRVVALAGEWVWPGFVDTHVHFCDPGRTDREDFQTGTRGALAGGVTTVVEMPVTEPPPVRREILEHKKELVAPKALVDYGLWGALEPGTWAEMEALRQSGVRLFKGFMYDYQSDAMKRISDWDLLNAVERAAALDAVVAVHAENHELIRGASERLGAHGRDAAGRDHPLVAEAEAVRRATFLAEAAGGPLHIVHASGGSTVEIVDAARRTGAAVTVETCPHYLAFTDDDARERGPWLRCAPPVRSADEQASLWDALVAGRIDMVVSDHSPLSRAQKEAGETDLRRAPNGLPGVETLVPYMITAWVARRGLPPERLWELCSRNPAKLAGLYPRKGSLSPGADADFVVVDMDASWTLRDADLHTKHQWSPWSGAKLAARVQRVFVRGTEAYRDGEVLVEPGFGRFVAAPPVGSTPSATPSTTNDTDG